MSPSRAHDAEISWGTKMLLSTKKTSRLHLTAELRADEVLAKPSLKKTAPRLVAAEPNRFPPVEDVVVRLDRTALRAFVA